MDQLVISKQTAAEQLDVSVATIERLLRNGDLTTVRIRRSIKVDTKSIKDYIKRNTVRIQEEVLCHTSVKARRITGRRSAPTSSASKLEKILKQQIGAKQ